MNAGDNDSWPCSIEVSEVDIEDAQKGPTKDMKGELPKQLDKTSVDGEKPVEGQVVEKHSES